jgi:adsorption protein B
VPLFSFSDIWPYLLGTLTVVLLLSGIDDLVPSFIYLWFVYVKRLHRKYVPPPELVRERKIAIFVPCWKESAVIASMVRHNISAIRYRNYDFFLGVYPNDKATWEVARHLSETFGRVHVAACPHPGPTSKADCLNWIYRLMVAYEEEHSVYFDTVVLHDAEDLIHPEALSVISRERGRNAMVQVPVLPLPTSVTELTHGCYCDDFAEYHSVDMRARQFSRSFIPSSGVGTGFARHILQRLAGERNGLIFNPASLTEDYEAGVYVFNAGYRQRFVPLQAEEKGFRATREYFPRRIKSAIRQRTRWVTGIALQSWARDGWRGSFSSKYWFWRDRKGLLANPLSLLTNLLFIAGVADFAAASLEHRPWHFAVANPILLRLCWLSTALQCVRLSMRMYYTGRIYGPAMALGVPIRSFHDNIINCFASLGALWQFAHARFSGRPLRWLKTDHSYPNRSTLTSQYRNLTEVLVSEGYLTGDVLEELKAEIRSDEFLADLLLNRGLVSEDKLCRAVSLQGGVPFTAVTLAQVRKRVMRTLPLHVGKRFGLIPYSVKNGRLFLAGRRIPEGDWQGELASWTRLPLEFQLVTKQDFEQLKSLLESRATA